eukprot:7382328-Prymnesium_polylepis.1
MCVCHAPNLGAVPSQRAFSQEPSTPTSRHKAQGRVPENQLTLLYRYTVHAPHTDCTQRCTGIHAGVCTGCSCE